MTSKQFWRLVRNAVKKAGSLSALRDANGVLATARARIEEIVQVCRLVSEHEVEKVIAGLKVNRAPGVDGVTSSMLKLAGPLFIRMFTGLINSVFEEGQVSESLAVGKMTLIDKKAPSLLVKDKRPLTVPSVLLSVITKILHSRLDPICEAEGYYGCSPVRFP